MKGIHLQNSVGIGLAPSRYRKRAALKHVTLIAVLLLAFLHAPLLHAASVCFSDTLGNPVIFVEPDTDFDVVLNVSDVTALAGYRARITATGPVSFTGGATHGTWFAAGHSVYGPYETSGAPPDYHSAMLLSPTSISGSGALVVFHFHADSEGTASVDVDPLMFVLGDVNAAPIPADPPATISIIIEAGGEGLLGGGGDGSLSTMLALPDDSLESSLTADESSGEGGEMLLDGGECDDRFIEANANHDTCVDLLDLICIRNRISAYPVADPDAFRCDVNADGRVNILDLTYAINRLDPVPPAPLPLVAAYGTTTVQTMFSEPIDTLWIDTEADGETSILLSIVGWFAEEDLDVALDCSCGQTCCTLTYPPASYGKAQLTFSHVLNPEAPEIHSVAVTVTSRNLAGCARAMTVVFSEIGIPEAQGLNGHVYAPVGSTKTVNALIGGQAPTQGEFSWKAEPPAVITPTPQSNVVDLSSPDAGVFRVEATFTLGEYVSVRTFHFVAFEVQFVKAIRPDATETSHLDVFTTPGATGLHARIFPSFVPVTSWDWSGTQRIDPDPACTIEFGYQDDFSFQVVGGEPGSATLTINGYADGVEFEVHPQAVTPFGTACIRQALRPHVILPVFAASITGSVEGVGDVGFRYWAIGNVYADTRIPCSGHDTSAGTPLFFGAPNVVTVGVEVSTMREITDCTWEWEIIEGAADVVNDDTAGYIIVTQPGLLVVGIAPIVNGVRLQPATLRANVSVIQTPGNVDAFYAGMDEINEECYIEFGIPIAGMPPDVTLSNGYIAWQYVEEGSLVTRLDFGAGGAISRFYSLFTTISADPIYRRYAASRLMLLTNYRLMVLRGSHEFYLNTEYDCSTDLFSQEGGASRNIELQFDPCVNPADVDFSYSFILADVDGPGTCSLSSEGASAKLTVNSQSSPDEGGMFNRAWIDVSATPVSLPYASSSAARTECFVDSGGTETMCNGHTSGTISHEVEHNTAFLAWSGPGTSFPVPLPGGTSSSVEWWYEDPDGMHGPYDYSSESYFFPPAPGLWGIFVNAVEGPPELINEYCAYCTLIVFAVDAATGSGAPYFIAVNDDDDNRNGLVDLDPDDSAVAGEDDLIRMPVAFSPPLSFLRSRGVAFTVETTGVNLYAAPDKSVPFNASIPSHLADQLYVEAVQGSTQADDVSFVLTLTPPNEPAFVQTVAFTAFQVIGVEIEDPEAEGTNYRACDGGIFGTVAPDLRVHYRPDIPEITNNLSVSAGGRSLNQYLAFQGGYASGVIPAPAEEDSFGYYAGRNRTSVEFVIAGRIEFRREYVSFHYIISEDPVPGGGMQFLQHEEMLSHLVQQGSDYVVDGLVVAQFDHDITDARLSEIIREENLLVVGLQRYYQVLVFRTRSGQDQQEIAACLAALPEEPYVFIPGAYDFDPVTGDFEWERAALDSEVNLAAFVNVPPDPADYFVSHPTFNTPVFLVHDASADAHVAGGGSQNTNFGTEEMLEIDSAAEPEAVRKLAYMQFDLREVRKLVGTVELYFILMEEAADSVSLYALDDDAWQEDTITYATAPSLNPDGTLDPNGIQLVAQIELDELNPITNRQFAVDVTDFVTAEFQGDKIASFILYSEAGGLISIASREYDGCEPFLFFDPPELPEDAACVEGASFRNLDNEKVYAVFDPLKGKWYNVEALRSAGLIETRLKDGEAVEYIDWDRVTDAVPGLSPDEQAILFLQSHITLTDNPLIAAFIDQQMRGTMGLMEYTDAGDVTISLVKGDIKGVGFAVAGVVIPGMTGKTLQVGIGKLGKITGVSRLMAFKTGRLGLRRVARSVNLKEAQVMVKGRIRKWKPGRWGFDAVFEKGDNFVLAKVDDGVVLDPNTFDLIIGEAKGGTSRLGGIWRRFVGGKRYLRQMGTDGDWVRDVVRRMRQHGDDVDKAMADKIEQALTNGKLQGLIVSTPIKSTEIMETKVVQVVFDP